MSVFFLTGYRVSAVVAACVGHLETNGAEHYLNVTERQYKLLLVTARPVLAYVERAGIKEDKEGPIFRPFTPKGTSFVRRNVDRKTPWRLVKKCCKATWIDPDYLGQCGIGIHTLRKTAINEAIRTGAQVPKVRDFADHSDIRTTELYFDRKEEDGEVAARKIGIRLTGRKDP
jgi:integrase